MKTSQDETTAETILASNLDPTTPAVYLVRHLLSRPRLPHLNMAKIYRLPSVSQYRGEDLEEFGEAVLNQTQSLIQCKVLSII